MPVISIVTTVNKVIDRLRLHLQDRTSWDGLTIRHDCIPPDQLCAWAGQAYGAWTLWKTDKPK